MLVVDCYAHVGHGHAVGPDSPITDGTDGMTLFSLIIRRKKSLGQINVGKKKKFVLHYRKTRVCCIVLQRAAEFQLQHDSRP